MTLSLRRRKLGVVLLFLVHGLVESTWVSRIPEIQKQLHADTGPLGVALLGSAVGAMLSMPFTGWLLGRHEGRRILIVSSLLWCSALPLMGLAKSVSQLMAALIVYGMVGGAMDISMNAFGTVVDREMGRPVMSYFHGMFSLGGMVGAAAGVLIVRGGIRVEEHFLAAAAVLVIVVLSTWPLFPRTPPELAQGGVGGSIWPARPLVALGALAFCVLFGERAMADWTGIYLVQRGATNAFAAAGYASFSAAMTGGRFTGDRLIERFGAERMLIAGSALATSGLVTALLLGVPWAALVGFALVGAGFSVVVPILYRAASAVPGVGPGSAIATVTTMGYLGFFAGPPLVGFAAQVVSLRWALLLVAVLSGTVVLFARSALRMR